MSNPYAPLRDQPQQEQFADFDDGAGKQQPQAPNQYPPQPAPAPAPRMDMYPQMPAPQYAAPYVAQPPQAPPPAPVYGQELDANTIALMVESRRVQMLSMFDMLRDFLLFIMTGWFWVFPFFAACFGFLGAKNRNRGYVMAYFISSGIWFGLAGIAFFSLLSATNASCLQLSDADGDGALSEEEQQQCDDFKKVFGL
eukprot:TRINITY_DN3353_c0_g1_i2.p1 TRINITY_DN3353_c0_g1~~TRINITY_DN3353_c0_g1_i2.p1  ORF type:complete len:197 (+),score=51.58 TRINITY_DN3353_c0_g1_i2:91-681(+)